MQRFGFNTVSLKRKGTEFFSELVHTGEHRCEDSKIASPSSSAGQEISSLI